MLHPTVRHILEIKGNLLWCIRPDASVFDALRMMSKKDVGALLVFDNEKLVGIISERDYARKIILLGKTSRDTCVEEIMSKTVYTIHPDQTLEEAMQMMDKKHVRHLPVQEHGQLIGIISIGDIVKAIMYKQREELKNLEDTFIAQMG